MTKEEFKKGDFTQVKRNNIDDSKVINIRGLNLLEGLINIYEPSYFGGDTWVRFENVDIII
tara:strand:- start:336 stop:518 length:183 start_codon:yes stop_codon:yes gene_type:complete